MQCWPCVKVFATTERCEQYTELEAEAWSVWLRYYRMYLSSIRDSERVCRSGHRPSAWQRVLCFSQFAGQAACMAAGLAVLPSQPSAPSPPSPIPHPNPLVFVGFGLVWAGIYNPTSAWFLR